MRKLGVIALAAAFLVVPAAVVLAQYVLPVVRVDGQVTPAAGATASKPRNGSLSFDVAVNRGSGSTPSEIVLIAPRHVRIDGRGLRFCPATQINNEGVSSCPEGSRVGAGRLRMLVGPEREPYDFALTIFAGSRNELALYLAGKYAIALPAAITDAGAPFGQKITIAVRARVQQPVTGRYAAITRLTARLGPARGNRRVTRRVGGRKRRVTRRTPFVAVRGCPRDGTHDLGVRFTFAANPQAPPRGSEEARATDECAR